MRYLPICSKSIQLALIILFSLILSGCQSNSRDAELSDMIQRNLMDQQRQLALLIDESQQRLQMQQLNQQSELLRLSSRLELLGQQLDRQQIAEEERFRRLLARSQRSATNPALIPPRAESVSVNGVTRSEKLLLGRSEWLGFPLQRLVLAARIDSGANTSSLDAQDLVDFERDGQQWVRFSVHFQDGEQSRQIEIEAPVIRRVRIRQAVGAESRPVVELPVRIGQSNHKVEFTLTDRGELTYPALLGRRFMMDVAMVDVSKNFIQGRPEFEDQGEDATTQGQTLLPVELDTDL
ncbi:ATP-dependent zinc protease [Nitrincola sp. MINF-07-Sa-05]|uniref:ATP-dependent zinc protease family protein n=1 Tax=Nitrincola salilacus TaxID=3400273 RepID=UPI003918021D